MRHVRFGLALGALTAIVGIGACALDEGGTYSDSGVPDVTSEVGFPDASLDMNAAEDVTYDVPDLGMGETESGGPCTCVTSIPAGYSVVEYVPNSRPNCDTPNYGGHTDWMESPTAAPSTCSCTCATPNPAPLCSCGQPATFNISSGNGNCTDVTNETATAALAPGCDKTSQSINPGGNKLNNMLAAPSAQNQCAPQGGSCQNPAKTTNFPPFTTEMGRSCPLTAPTATCNGGVCVPTQGAPYALCITNMTNDTCPGDFVVPHLVGTSVQDNRSCGPDPCTTCNLVDAGSCGVPQLTLYDTDNNCGSNGSPVTLPVDNTTCKAANYGNGQTFASARYSVGHLGGACGLAGAFTPMGGVGVTGGYTICCHP